MFGSHATESAEETAVRLEQQRARGARAEQLLKDELVVEALAAIEAQYIEAALLAAREVGNEAVAARLLNAVRIKREFTGHLEKVVTEGGEARVSLTQIEDAPRRKWL